MVVADRDGDGSRGVAEGVRDAGGTASFVEVDVATPESVEAIVSHTLAQFGRLDIAVNNAGISGEASRTGEHSIEGWQRVIDINLNGVFYCMRHEIP